MPSKTREYTLRMMEANKKKTEVKKKAEANFLKEKLSIAVEVFPVRTSFVFVPGKKIQFKGRFSIVGHYLDSYGDMYIQYKKLDVMGRPNGKMRDLYAYWFDSCVEFEE